MTDPLVLTVLVVSFTLATLVLATLLVAARADHQATVRGPLAHLDEIERRIVAKQEALVDLEAELDKLRETSAGFANVQAEADAVRRQLDEWQAEWNQMDARRQEVVAIRAETEEAYARRAEATRDLSEKTAELRERTAELERVARESADARRLQSEIDARTEQLEALEARIADLRSKAAELKDLCAREDALRTRIPELAGERSRLESDVAALGKRRDEAEAHSKEAVERLAALRTAMDETGNTNNSLRTEHRRLRDAITELKDRRDGMAAQAAALEAQLDHRPRTGGTGPDSDPLADLHTLPRFLEQLRDSEEHPHEEESEALDRVRKHFEECGLSYPSRVVRAFHTAMKVNETTQMAVLAGVSGTGKSQLPRRYAEAMGIGFLHVPVQPRWDSPQDLMGFYNYIESRFRPTDMARALFHMDVRNQPEENPGLQDRMLLVLLDEMNLARVEYYFSDFLSRLESRPGRKETSQQRHGDAEIELDIPMPRGQAPPRIFPGYSLLFAGTMNEDESTQSLSDKVVDRANILRFAAPKAIADATGSPKNELFKALPRSRWEDWVRDSKVPGNGVDHVRERLDELVELMRNLHRPIGHRVGQAILAYAANYPRDGYTTDEVPLADQVEMRLLPKLRGIDIDTAEAALDGLRKHVDEVLHDSDLAGAIKVSMDASRETGQFVWRGVTRT